MPTHAEFTDGLLWTKTTGPCEGLWEIWTPQVFQGDGHPLGEVHSDDDGLGPRVINTAV